MTRAELEAAIWRQLAAYRISELRLPSGRRISPASMRGLLDRILAAADAYADEAAGPRRLAEAAAEAAERRNDGQH